MLQLAGLCLSSSSPRGPGCGHPSPRAQWWPSNSSKSRDTWLAPLAGARALFLQIPPALTAPPPHTACRRGALQGRAQPHLGSCSYTPTLASSLYITHTHTHTGAPDGTRTSGNRPSPQCTAWLFLGPTLSFLGEHQPSLPTKHGAHPPHNGQRPCCTPLPVHTSGMAGMGVGWAPLPTVHVGAVQRPWGNCASFTWTISIRAPFLPCCSLLCGLRTAQWIEPG